MAIKMLSKYFEAIDYETELFLELNNLESVVEIMQEEIKEWEGLGNDREIIEGEKVEIN